MENETRTYIDRWREAADDFLALLRSLDDADWDAATDLPGWRVSDVAAHVAHLESVLAGHPQPDADTGARADGGDMSAYTEAGVAARRGRSPAELVGELSGAVEERHGHLLAHPVEDPSATSDGFGPGLGWDWNTLLRNRVLDVWMHDQDVRRAVGRPGGLDTPAAHHTADMMAAALPVVFAKRAGAPAGASLVLDATGDPARRLAVLVGDDGRARLVAEPPAEPTVRLGLTAQDWLVLAGGRRGPDDVEARLEGDSGLGRAVLASLAVTP